MSDESTPIKGHDYDGIQEYDNPLPMWWLITFFGAIIFGYIYWLHYESGAGPTLRQEFEADMKKMEANKPKRQDSGEALAKLAGDSGARAAGGAVFKSKCAVCHGPELQGGIGPNLTDDFWLHGKGTLPDIVEVVSTGVLDKGMPSWSTQLSADEINSVAVFVASARGSNPPNPKAPQGEKVAR